jgi:hypothetical protein
VVSVGPWQTPARVRAANDFSSVWAVGQAFEPDTYLSAVRLWKPDLRTAKGSVRTRACSVIILERANQSQGWDAKPRTGWPAFSAKPRVRWE